MIHTITLNPALDISGTVDQLVPDEKSYVYDEIQTPGGNGINAAIIAHRLGGPVTATGFLGGSNGDEIKQLLKKENVRHRFVEILGNTRMNLTVTNSRTHRQTRLSFPGPRIQSKELNSLIKIVSAFKKTDLVIIGGSLPPGIKASDVSHLVRLLNTKGIPCMVDMPGKILAQVISSKPLFIKPNLVEFQELVGRKVKSIKSILPLVRKLNNSVPLICVSSVEGGAILVTKDEAWYGRIPKVKVLSSVGAGDSMVGAMAAAIEQNRNMSIKDLLQSGLAASCATLIEEGMVLGSKKAIIKYRPKIYMKEIK